MKRFLLDLAKAPSRFKVLGLRGFVSVAIRTVLFDLRNWLWDMRHGVNTRQRIPVSELALEGLPNSENAEAYTASTPALLDRLGVLNLDWNSFVFVDLGCGKGKALLLAARFSFMRVIGVELSDKLARLARQNVSTYRYSDLKCRNIEVLNGDAAAYMFPAERLMVYCFNSFSGAVVREVLRNLNQSLQQHPRAAYFLYVNPVWESVFVECGFMRPVWREQSYQVYAAVTMAGDAAKTPEQTPATIPEPALRRAVSHRA